MCSPSVTGNIWEVLILAGDPKMQFITSIIKFSKFSEI